MTIQKTKQRCARCFMQVPVCMCALIPSMVTKSRLTLIAHAFEIRKPTNTGILATRCLANSHFAVHGHQDKPLDQRLLVPNDYENIVLFPCETATMLTPDFVRGFAKPINLIVPDGNWKQANSIPKRIACLKALPRVILPAGALSEYKLRREAKQRPDGLATMEAIARAFCYLEGQDVYEQLMDIFRIKVSRSLWIRGTIKAWEVYKGLENPTSEEVVHS